MSKGTMLALLVGIVLFVVGIVLLLVWWGDFLVVLKGALGPMLALGGVLIVAIAWSEYQAAKEMERLTAQTQPTTPPPAQPTTPSETKPAEEQATQQQ